jgi:hypothetical protein
LEDLLGFGHSFTTGGFTIGVEVHISTNYHFTKASAASISFVEDIPYKLVGATRTIEEDTIGTIKGS